MQSSQPQVIVIAPAPGTGGVGDYAADIGSALTHKGADLTWLLTGGPGGDTIRSILRLRRTLRRTLKDLGQGTIVHLEMSAASVAPLWAIADSLDLVTATIHDPPHIAWWPARTRLLNRSRVAVHGVHRPVAKYWWALERRRTNTMQLIALSHVGCTSLNADQPAILLPHYVPARPAIIDAPTRLLAVGLFGHMYGGKGFERLKDLRRILPSSVSIHVAGRGTEVIPPLEGVRAWGPVEGDREAAFFASIRALLLPYDPGERYGPSLSASGAAARAYAYGTPVAATAVRSFPEEAEHGALVLVPFDTPAMAAAVLDLISSPARLSAASQASLRLAYDRNPSRVAGQLMDIWHGMSTRGMLS